MERQLLEKISRYVELSIKFSKTDSELFTSEELSGTINTNGSVYDVTINNGSICLGNSINSPYINGGSVYLGNREIYVDEKGVVRAKDEKKQLSRGEQLKASAMIKANNRATLLDEYDEYIKLRTQLKGYLRGIEELSKGDCTCGPNEGCSNCPKK